METNALRKQYRMGIDVGLNSVGLAAVEVDDHGTPIAILNMESIIHDGGIDPTANKSAGTRRAVSGAARRMRRLYRQRRRRLADLDQTLANLGWPITDLETIRDPWYPWKARAELVTRKVPDDERLYQLLSVAVRHMARHRGWRNPYMSLASLISETEPSKYFLTLTKAIAEKLDRDPDELRALSVAEIVQLARDMDIRERIQTNVNSKTGEITDISFIDVSKTLRGSERVGKDGQKRVGLLESKIHQSDNVRELKKIWDRQGLSQELFTTIATKVFQAKSPKGSAKERVARDDLDKTQRRAEKASLAFQRYRILTILTNLRVQEGGEPRLLTTDERQTALDFLWNPVDDKGIYLPDVTWADVSEKLGIARSALKGTAQPTEEGERASARPPVNVTGARIRESGIHELIDEWDAADEPYQEALIECLGNGSGSGGNQELFNRAEEFVASVPETVLAKLDELKLPEGRAAYSLTTLRKLTQRMLTTEDDLHAARKAIFHVSDDWKPTPEPIGTPVGNPAVDRVLKIVNRYILACQHTWGIPLSVNIEHTRNGLMSEKAAREIDRDNNARFARNRQIEAEIASYLHDQSAAVETGRDDSFEDNPDTPVTGYAIGKSKRDIDRWRALTRQEEKCLYCGVPLDYTSFEMDHILPRSGRGATNTQVNLAAVCRDCNHSKGNLPFATWANSGTRPQVNLRDALDRVDGFRFFGVESRDRRYQYRFKKEMKERLQRTDYDEETDSRSIESVGWMANELHHRIEAHFAQANAGTDQVTTVGVFRGWITSEARKASGIEKRLMLIGGRPGKNRLDRRHHSVDAATIAMIRQGAAQSLVVQNRIRSDMATDFDISQVLAERENLHRTYELTTHDYEKPEDERPRPAWTLYKGSNPELFDSWREQMESLAGLVQDHLDHDQVPVFELLRLRPGNSSGHEDTVRETVKIHLSDALPVELIDRSATPQQWVALTRHPDFDPEKGLPADPTRRIRVKDVWYEASDFIEFFPTSAGCVSVRGGYAELGSSFHHARIYRCTKRLRSGTKTFYAMMRVYNLDLLPFRGNATDLFTVDLPAQSISRRTAEERLRLAMDAGEAEYVGWIVPGDELLLDMSSQNSGAIGTFLNQFPGTCRWVVQGLFAPAKLHLRPRYLSGEGAIAEDSEKQQDKARIETPASSAKILSGQGYLPSVDVVFGKCHATVIRRDIFGRVRNQSSAHLPVTWGVDADVGEQD